MTTMPPAHRIDITHADGATEQLNWDRAKSGWRTEAGGMLFRDVSALADGFSLAGRLSRFDHSSFTDGSGLSGGVTTGSNTEFFADETYKGRVFGTLFATRSGTGCRS